jgi:hypothetical protein
MGRISAIVDPQLICAERQRFCAHAGPRCLPDPKAACLAIRDEVAADMFEGLYSTGGLGVLFSERRKVRWLFFAAVVLRCNSPSSAANWERVSYKEIGRCLAPLIRHIMIADSAT